MPNRKNKYADMDKFQKTRYRQRKKYYEKTARKYDPRPWNKVDDKMVLEHKISDTELSEKLKRSVKAIQNRRYVLKNSNRV